MANGCGTPDFPSSCREGCAFRRSAGLRRTRAERRKWESHERTMNFGKSPSGSSEETGPSRKSIGPPGGESGDEERRRGFGPRVQSRRASAKRDIPPGSNARRNFRRRAISSLAVWNTFPLQTWGIRESINRTTWWPTRSSTRLNRIPTLSTKARIQI